MHIQALEHSTSSPIDALASLMHLIESADRRLKGHGARTARYAVPLGHAAGLSPAELNDLCLASLLHDIGVLTIPQELLDKEEPLTDEEYALFQSHPRAGAELLAPIPVLRVAALWIAHHHERWDGCGYPYGLRGTFIPLGARILAVADTFDSLTSPQPYRPAIKSESALRLLQELAGSQLDPNLVALFIRSGLCHHSDGRGSCSSFPPPAPIVSTMGSAT
jgi:HD-GYP domain-containing protein (c-di-GMP phosphodiesterase class II)